MGTNPFLGFFRTLYLFAAGRVSFIKGSVGLQITMEDGKAFTVFRHVKVKPAHGQPQEAGALFKIRFRLARMGARENIRFSRLPMLVILGFHGFRSKMWMMEEGTGLCQGLYEWQTAEDAKRYSQSMAVAFMQKRSVPGSVQFEIISQEKGRYWALL